MELFTATGNLKIFFTTRDAQMIKNEESYTLFPTLCLNVKLHIGKIKVDPITGHAAPNGE
jgi:hypothetical protein